MFLFNFIILRISGNIGVASFGVVSVISLVVVAVFTGLSQGAQPVISSRHGANKPENVRTLLVYTLLAASFLSAAIYSVIFFNASGLTSVFNSGNNATLQSHAENGLKLYFIACPFIGFNIVMSTYFISIEKPLFEQIISLSRGLIILVPVAFLLSFLFEMNGVWCSYPASEFIAATIGFVLYLVNQKQAKKKGEYVKGDDK